jgi:hypothetical protein
MSLLDTASLIVTPNGYKEGKLYSVIPSDGSGDLSVTRATTATRVNSAGLVELVPYNLLSYSEQFDNAYWTKSSTTITANTTISPNGLQDADTAVFSSNGQIYRAISSNAVNTFSTYVKKGTNRYFSIQLETISVVYRAIYDLDTTTVTFTGTNTSASITDEGNGWFRVSVVNTTSDAIAYTTIQAASSGTSVSGGSGTFYIWGAQLVEGSTAKDYQKTETRLNIPRLDYSNGTCPSLLVEPQRTNLFQYSEQFDNVYWNKNNVSIVANSLVAPNGTTAADTMTSSGTTSFTYIATSSLVGTYTLSFYAKKGTSDYCWVYLNGYDAIFNLNTGAYVTSISNAPQSYNIENVGNGWFRVSITQANPSIDSVSGIGVATSNSFNGVVGSNIYLWGAQLELGNYATSYIPTTSASVTRNADVISKTGISSLIGQTEGALFVDFYVDNLSAQTNDPVIFSFNTSNYIEIFADGRVNYYDGSGNIDINLPSYGLTNGRHKFGIAYNTNDVAFYIDGSLAGTDTSGTPSAKSDLLLGFTNLSFTPELRYNAAALWKTRLTNTQLAELTTL